MDGYKYATVVNSNGEYQTRVLILSIEDTDTGVVSEQIQYYELKDGETLIEAQPPVMRPYAGADGFITPHWNFEDSIWEEVATEAEISDWETEHPEPERFITPEEKIASLEQENKILSQQIKLQAQQQEFLENCILEMGDVVYA